jgi:hypothetical protein
MFEDIQNTGDDHWAPSSDNAPQSPGGVSMGMRMMRRMKIMRVMKGAMNVRRSHLLVPKESSMILLLERTRGRNRRLSEDIGCEINYPNLSP